MPLYIEPVSPPYQMGDDPPYLIGARPGRHGIESFVAHVNAPSSKHRLILYLNFDERCTPADPLVRTVNPPQHGDLTLRQTSVRQWAVQPAWPPGDPRYRCRISNAPAISIEYTPAVGFSGRDLVVVDIDDRGHTDHIEFDIDVKPGI